MKKISQHRQSASSSVCCSPDGSHIASGDWEHCVHVWDAATGVRLLSVIGHSANVSSVCFSPDGRRIVSGSYDKTVCIWDAKTGARVLSMFGHTREVSSVCCSPDGRCIASGSWDRTARVWDISTGKQLLLPGHSAAVSSVSYSPDGRHVASGSWDMSVCVWDAATGVRSRSIIGTAPVSSLCYSPDGFHIVSGGWDNAVNIWHIDSGAPVLSTTGHTATVSSVCYSPDGRHIVSGSSDNTVRVWNALTGAEARPALISNAAVSSVCFSQDGRYIVSGCGKPTLHVWDAPTGEKLLTTRSEAALLTVRYSPDGRHMASMTKAELVITRTIDQFLVARIQHGAESEDAPWVSWVSASTVQVSCGLQQNVFTLTVPRATHEVAATVARLRRCLQSLRKQRSDFVSHPVAVLANVWHQLAARETVQDALIELRCLNNNTAIADNARERDAHRKKCVELINSIETPPDHLTPWHREGLTIVDGLINDLIMAYRALVIANADAIALGCDEIDQNIEDDSLAMGAPRSRENHQPFSRALNLALASADEVAERGEKIDAILGDAIFVPLQRAIDEMERRAQRAGMAEPIHTVAEALKKEASVPLEKVGSSADARIAVERLADLAEQRENAECTVQSAKSTLRAPSTKKDASAKTAAEATLEKAKIQAFEARTAFAALYRSKGRYVLSHFPEHREQMLALIPESLRNTNTQESRDFYDPAVSLDDFEVSTTLFFRAVRAARPLAETPAAHHFSSAVLATGCLRVAIKEFPDANALVREVSVLKQAENLGIKNVAEVLFAFSQNTTEGPLRYCMVNPWYEGGQVHEWAKNPDVDWYQRLSMALEISRAIKRLHDAGVTHVDLKPQNVVVEVEYAHTPAGSASGRRYHARIIDFGSSHVVDGDAYLLAATLTHTIAATVAYMAPELRDALEVAKGDKEKLKACTSEINFRQLDVFGLGKIFESMLLWDEIVLPRDTGQPSSKNVSHIRDLGQRMLLKSPDARPAMPDIVKELERLVECHSASAAQVARCHGSGHDFPPDLSATSGTSAIDHAQTSSVLPMDPARAPDDGADPFYPRGNSDLVSQPSDHL